MARALLFCALAFSAGCDGAGDAAAEAKQLEEAKLSWAGLSRCLVGKPLGDGEKASQRMLMSELAVISGKSAAKAGADWPANCDALVKQLLTQLEALKSDAAVQKFAPLQEQLRMAKGISAALWVSSKDEPLADTLFAAAREAGFDPPAEPAKTGPSAPAPAQPLPRDKLVLLGNSDGVLERTGAAPGDRVRFMVRGDKSTFFCSLRAGKGPLEGASCKPLDRQPGILSAPASGVGDGDYYFDSEPKAALWTPTGESFEGPFGDSSYVYEGGMIADVTRTNTGMTLVRYLGEKRGVKKAGMPKVVAGTWLGFRAGAALWRGPKRGTGKRPVIFHEVVPGKVPVTGKRELGEVGADVKFVEACRSGDNLVIALLGEGDPKKPDTEPSVSMAFRIGEDWKSAHTSTARFDVERPWQRSLSCRNEEGTFSWLEGDKVGQVRCTPEGCNKTMSGDLGLGNKSVKARVADLSGNALLVRVHRDRGVLRGVSDTVVMRFGPVANLADTPDEVLVGDDQHGGLPNLDKGLGLITSGGAALALVHSADKVFGVRIDAKGKFGKIAIAAAPPPAEEKK